MSDVLELPLSRWDEWLTENDPTPPPEWAPPIEDEIDPENTADEPFLIEELSDEEVLRVMAAERRRMAWCSARMNRAMARFARLREQDANAYAAEEVALATVASPASASARLAEAKHLVEHLPGTLALLELGRIDTQQAHVIADSTDHLPAELLPALERRILPNAPRWTPGTLRERIRYHVARLDPAGSRERRREHRTRRGVFFQDQGDGMATLTAELPTEHAYRIYRHLSEHAERARSAEDQRSLRACSQTPLSCCAGPARRATALSSGHRGSATPPSSRHDPMHLIHRLGCGCPAPIKPRSQRRRIQEQALNQLRADALVDLLLGNDREHVRTEVQVQVPASVLAGTSHEPGELAGAGHLDADTVRELAGNATWRRILTDPVDDTVLNVGRRRFPSPELARHVRARDKRCRFPGCPRSAHACHLDHTTPYADGGDTSHDNLAALCPRHNQMKEDAPWAAAQSQPGVVEWTSPTGTRRTVTPNNDRPPVLNSREPGWFRCSAGSRG